MGCVSTTMFELIDWFRNKTWQVTFILLFHTDLFIANCLQIFQQIYFEFQLISVDVCSCGHITFSVPFCIFPRFPLIASMTHESGTKTCPRIGNAESTRLARSTTTDRTTERATASKQRATNRRRARESAVRRHRQCCRVRSDAIIVRLIVGIYA